MYSVFAGAQLLSTLWMSQFSDRCGRRKAFLLSLFGSMVAFILQAAAWNVASLLAFRFVAGKEAYSTSQPASQSVSQRTPYTLG